MKTKFPRILWHYTGAEENLFELSKDDLIIFKLIVLHMPKGN